MSHSFGTADDFAELTADLAEQHGQKLTVHRIVERAVDVLDGADHASLTVRENRAFVTLVATSDLAAAADASQFDGGEGPAVDQTSPDEFFRSGDLVHDRRWPGWGPVAAAGGVGSVLSLRLFADHRPFGALNLYADESGRFSDPAEVDVAQIFAVHAATVLASAREVAGLETALTTRHKIGVAQGILVSRYGLSEHEAFAALRRVSQAENRKLIDVVDDVLRTRRLPGQDT